MTNLDSVIDLMVEQMNMLKEGKIDLETAKVCSQFGKVCVDGFKVKAQVCSVMSRTENPKTTKYIAEESGIINSGSIKIDI